MSKLASAKKSLATYRKKMKDQRQEQVELAVGAATAYSVGYIGGRYPDKVEVKGVSIPMVGGAAIAALGAFDMVPPAVAAAGQSAMHVGLGFEGSKLGTRHR